jgi:molybdopterin-guanine dinucleotide biosynthesis protein A
MQPITLAVLAGGKGKRMGFPKQQLEIDGRPVLEYLHARFGWKGPTMLVTAPGRKRPPGAELFDREVVDAVGGEGPLRGMLTALEHSLTDWVIFATVDMPGIGPEQLEWIVSRVRGTGLLLERWIDGKREIDPFPCAIHRSAVDTISRRLVEGRRSVYSLAEHRGFAVDTAPSWEARVWANLNSPEDFVSWASRPWNDSAE